MKNTQKKLVGIIALGTLIIFGIASTYAFLTAKTATLTNTFIVGNVALSLTEPAWTAEGATHKIVPGAVLDKDPTVTVKSNSEESYVFIELDFSAEFYEFKQYYQLNLNPQWQEIASNGTTTVYAYETTVPANSADTKLSPLFSQISFSNELTSEHLNQMGEPKIDVTAYGIQANGLATALEAWQEVSK